MSRQHTLFLIVTAGLLALAKWAETLLLPYAVKFLLTFSSIVDHSGGDLLKIRLTSIFIIYMLCGFICFFFYRGERMFHWILAVGIFATLVNVATIFVLMFLFSKQPSQLDYMVAGVACVGIWLGGRFSLLTMVALKIKYQLDPEA